MERINNCSEICGSEVTNTSLLLFGFSWPFRIWTEEAKGAGRVWVRAQASWVCLTWSGVSVLPVHSAFPWYHLVPFWHHLSLLSFSAAFWGTSELLGEAVSSPASHRRTGAQEWAWTSIFVFAENFNPAFLPLTTQFRSSMTWQDVQLNHIVCSEQQYPAFLLPALVLTLVI